MSKRRIVSCLLLGPPGWLYLAYKLLVKYLPAEFSHDQCVPKGILKGYRIVKW
jgi:hypothetical protein